MSEINVNRFNGRDLHHIQPLGGRTECDNNNQRGKVMNRLTHRPGDNLSNTFWFNDQNGNVESVEEKPYKMATRFMLDPEQPKNNANWPYNITTGTFHSLFGPPSPTLSKAEKARLNARKPSNRNIKPSKKPLPVNPLTGDILGLPGVKSPEPPRRQSNQI
eukprot:TRINITY_DN19606_c0_g1_i3.p1 TRINITY_DN19606_c0_g1~~TRINITY_DN19606_c0_g1_i3.p1  ORF type:complete len:161 (+),score=42.82 TRINITY_DN19606_c0_g1_i3:71-553(+)